MIERELEAMDKVVDLLIPATGSSSHLDSRCDTREIDEPRWMSIPDRDNAHPMPRSRPRLEPGVQLPAFGDYSPLHLFQLFFSKRLMTMLIQDTNKFNDERKARENKCYR